MAPGPAFALLFALLGAAEAPSASGPPFRLRVVGGAPTNIAHYPYMVSLLVHNTHACGGTALTRRWVLTASHCFYDSTFKPWPLHALTVMAGSSLSESAEKVLAAQIMASFQLRKVAETAMAPGHVPPTVGGDIGTDLAAARLARPLRWSRWVQPVPLYVPPGTFSAQGVELSDEEIMQQKHYPLPGTKCETLGWGLTQPRIADDLVKSSGISNTATYTRVVLNKATLGVISTVKCREHHPKVFSFSHVCAVGIGRNDACNGDSGGPLMCGGRQVALVSMTADGCSHPEVPSVYARVGPNLRWLRAVADPTNRRFLRSLSRNAAPASAPARRRAGAAAAVAVLFLLLRVQLA